MRATRGGSVAGLLIGGGLLTASTLFLLIAAVAKGVQVGIRASKD